MHSSPWAEVQLGDLVEIRHGFAFQGQYFRDQPTSDVLLTPGNFGSGGGFKDDKLKYYDGPVSEEFVLSPGDLLVTMTDLSKDSGTLGYPALVPGSSKLRYLHNQRLGKVVPRHSASVDSRYLYYVLCSPAYRTEVLAGATGTTVKHTSPSRIGAFRFRLPSLDEQRRLARTLGTLDDKIRLNRRSNRTLESIARAIFKSWFVDFDPVRKKMEGGEVGLSRDLAALFPSSLEPSAVGPIPQGWRVSEIGGEAQAVGGSTPSTVEDAFWNGEIAFATPRDLAGLSAAVLLHTERRVTEAGAATISSGILEPGVVLMSSRAPIGYLALAEIPVCVNQGFIAMRCHQTLSNHYVLQWARFNMESIVGYANGTTFLEISKRNFRPLPVVVPPQSLVLRFTAIAESLHREVVHNLRESETLKSLREALVSPLLNGEVRVQDAEASANLVSHERRMTDQTRSPEEARRWPR